MLLGRALEREQGNGDSRQEEGEGLTSPVLWAYIISSSGLSRKATAFSRRSILPKSSFSSLRNFRRLVLRVGVAAMNVREGH